MRITAINYYSDNLIHYMRVNKLKTRKLEESSMTRENSTAQGKLDSLNSSISSSTRLEARKLCLYNLELARRLE